MQINNDHSVCQLQAEGSKMLTVKVNWFKTYFDLTIFDGINAYTGDIKEEEIVKTINHLGTLTVDDYIKRCRTALTTNNGCEKFIYSIDNNIFQWKKVEFDMKITFGSVRLTPIPVVDSLHDMLNVLVTNYHQLEKKASCLYEEKNLLENDNKELLEKIDECTHIKNDMETELYNQFLVVLNTKKKKISELQAILKSNKIDASKITNEEKDAKSAISDLYECDTEVETDDNTDNDEPVENKKTSCPENTSSRFGMFDSDSEDKIACLPKRNKTKPSKSEVDESETMFVQDNSKNHSEFKDTATNVIKPNQSKNMLNKRSNVYNVQDQIAGPSGMKMSKIEKHKSDEVSKNNARIGATNGESSKNCDEIIKNHHPYSNNSKNSNAVRQTTEIETSENKEKISSIDDILAKLVA